MLRSAMVSLLWMLCACQQNSPSRPSQAASPPDSIPASAMGAATGTSAGNAVIDDSAFVLPGDYSQGTSLADLEARFGKANVKITDLPGEDGFYHRVVLFPDDPTRRAYMDFYEDEPLSGVHSISVRDVGSKWRGKHGVHVGMSLAELQKTNGKRFNFNGFDSEHRAWAHDAWSPALDDDDDQLGNLDVDEGEHMYFNVDLGLREAAMALPAGAWPVDEYSVSSNDPRYPRLGELVEVTGFSASTSLDDEWD